MRKTVMLCFCTMMLVVQSFAQSPVSGKIVDDQGRPIPGVSILKKNAQAIGITSNNGEFTLNIMLGDTLVFSAVGYDTKEAIATENLTITLRAGANSLAEVVVTGVGVATSKRRLGIAVESISSDKLPAAPTADIGQALVGKVAGAQISSTNGSPGAPLNILLRGINTLQGNTMPMILLDGVEVRATDLNSLDLNGIERVEVVQGAAAATIYGAQGANGVIQLFSKKGKGGRININLSSNVSGNSLLNIGDLGKARLHSLETNANNEVTGGSSGEPLAFDSAYSHYAENVVWNSLDPLNNNNKPYNRNLQWYDHYKMFFQDAYTYNNSVSVSGSKEKVDFNFLMSNNSQESVFKNNGGYKRTNLLSNLGLELAKGLKFRSITQLVYTRNTLIDPTGRTVLYALNNSRPFADYEYKSPDGNYGAYFGDAVGVNGFNPNYMFQYGKYKSTRTDIVQSFNLNYKPIRFVELDALYGLNYQNEQAVYNILDQSNNLNADYWIYWLEYYSPRTSYGAPSIKDQTGEVNIRQDKTIFQNFKSTATIRLDFADDFKINIPLTSTTLIQWDYRKNDFHRYWTSGLDAPPYTPYGADEFGNYKVQVDFKEPFVTYGYVVNQRFEWGDIFGIAGGIRSDYSSAFGRGSKPFTFPNANGYFNITALPFWQNSGLASTWNGMKLRAAWGKAGIQPGAFQRYPSLSTQVIGTSNAFVFPNDYPNPDLNVEVSEELEIGTDMSFNVLQESWLRNINFSFSWWKRSTNNAIWSVDVAPSTGIGTRVDNAFSLSSKGVQASLNINVLNSRNFTWNFTTNFSRQSSEITDTKGNEIIVTSNAGSSNYVLNAGEKIGQLFGFLGLHSVDQVDPTTGQSFIPKESQGVYAVASNGWVVDTATKQPYFTSTQYSFGDPNPKFNMSFMNDITYKDFLTFSFQFDWVNGSHLYNQTKEWMYRDGIHKDYDNQITINGQTGAWSAFYRGVYAQISRNGTKNYFYEDASFVRLRNISLALDFAKLFDMKGFKRLQLVLTGRNMLTFTNYTGMDPEISSGTANSPFDRGVDHNTIPNLKTYQVGLNVGF